MIVWLLSPFLLSVNNTLQSSGNKDGSTYENQALKYTTLTKEWIKVIILSINAEKNFDKI